MQLNELTRFPRTTRMVQNRINDIFNSYFPSELIDSEFNDICHCPSMDVEENDKLLTIQVELPSLKEQDIKIHTNKNRIFISGEKKVETKDDSSNYHIREIKRGKFSRSLSLPFNIDSSKTKATFVDGTLTIKIDKPEEESDSLKAINISKDGN